MEYYSSSSALPSLPSINTPAVYPPGSTPIPPISSMPSLTTTILTSAVTLTSFVTVTTGQYLPPAIVDAIEGLAPCSQSITFESLADSTCNPANFPCICTELRRLGVADSVFQLCSAADSQQFLTFQRNVCSNIQPVVPSTSIVVSTTPVPVINSTIRPSPAPPVSTPLVFNVTPAPSPFKNATTTTISVVSSIAAGTPTIVAPVSSTKPPPPNYTGGAIGFGSMKMGALAGTLGLMSLVFAEL